MVSHEFVQAFFFNVPSLDYPTVSLLEISPLVQCALNRADELVQVKRLLDE
jgi:hypothetical protein